MGLAAGYISIELLDVLADDVQFLDALLAGDSPLLRPACIETCYDVGNPPPICWNREIQLRIPDGMKAEYGTAMDGPLFEDELPLEGTRFTVFTKSAPSDLSSIWNDCLKEAREASRAMGRPAGWEIHTWGEVEVISGETGERIWVLRDVIRPKNTRLPIYGLHAFKRERYCYLDLVICSYVYSLFDDVYDDERNEILKKSHADLMVAERNTNLLVEKLTLLPGLLGGRVNWLQVAESDRRPAVLGKLPQILPEFLPVASRPPAS